MKKAILLVAVLIGLSAFSAPKAEARPFIGVSLGGPAFYPYGYGYYPYGGYYDYPGYYGGYSYYGRPYYRHAYYGGYRGGYYGGYRGGYYRSGRGYSHGYYAHRR